jgi:predicted phage terminase large subunit-like protein
MPSGRVVIVATRWHKSDLIGKLINDMSNDEEVDQYHVVEFPAILNENTDEEKALWPQFFDLEALRRTRSTMPAYQWNAQYQQNPTGDSSSICKRDWWRIWDSEEPPDCEYIIQAIDAAAELNNRSDFTSITTWGVFWNDETSMSNLILLNSVRERMEFPELKVKVLDEYREWQPDSCLVEKKSSGTALYQELRRMGVPVGEYTPHRGTINNPNNKYARLNSVIDMVREGIIWVPHTRWAEQLVEELAEFPYGDHDDVVDTTIMALTRFRQGGFAQLATDHKDEPAMFKRRGGYY